MADTPEVAQQPAAPTGTGCAGEWYAVQSKPREEQRALENLENQGYTVFYPTWKVAKLRGGKEVPTTEALFPGYLFVHLQAGVDNWHPIRSTRGVLRMVAFGRKPTPVPSNVVAAIQQRLQQMGCKKALTKGDKVSIASKTGTEIDAIFSRYDGEERVIVLLTMMQRVREVRVPVAQVKKR